MTCQILLIPTYTGYCFFFLLTTLTCLLVRHFSQSLADVTPVSPFFCLGFPSQVGRAGRFGTKGLAITFVSSAADSDVLNQVICNFIYFSIVHMISCALIMLVALF